MSQHDISSGAAGYPYEPNRLIRSSDGRFIVEQDKATFAFKVAELTLARKERDPRLKIIEREVEVFTQWTREEQAKGRASGLTFGRCIRELGLLQKPIEQTTGEGNSASLPDIAREAAMKAALATTKRDSAGWLIQRELEENLRQLLVIDVEATKERIVEEMIRLGRDLTKQEMSDLVVLDCAATLDRVAGAQPERMDADE